MLPPAGQPHPHPQPRNVVSLPDIRMVTHRRPTDATTWFHCPDSPRMQRAPPQRLVRGGAGMCAGIASRAGGVKVVLIGSGPHGGGALHPIRCIKL